MDEPLIKAVNVSKEYQLGGLLRAGPKEIVHAVSGVTLDVVKGETLGLVGESGCGKTTLGRCIIRLIELTSGQIYYKGTDITKMGDTKMKGIRKNMQIIFQDVHAALDPRMTVNEILSEPYRIHGILFNKETIYTLLDVVGLPPESVEKFPHEFSGGQRQRIGIARALALRPDFVIADEPVSALDVSIRSQILNLMKDLQREFDLTYLLIAHDMGVVRYASDRVAVMYLGKIVELAGVDDLFRKPTHPYSQALISAVPIPNPKVKRKRIVLEGDPASSAMPPSGCRFHTRCWAATQRCAQVEPQMKDIGNRHLVACHLA